MSRPSKPFEVLVSENKSHRTKAELEQRKQGEESLASGSALKERSEVRCNKYAHDEFTRINKLLKKIKKNDALYEAIINRYCLIQGECFDLEDMILKLKNDIDDLAERLVEKDIEYLAYLEYKDKIQNKILACDKQIQTKRKMLLDIEKENILTIASALRSIPKKAEEKAEEDPMANLLNRRRG